MGFEMKPYPICLYSQQTKNICLIIRKKKSKRGFITMSLIPSPSGYRTAISQYNVRQYVFKSRPETYLLKDEIPVYSWTDLYKLVTMTK